MYHGPALDCGLLRDPRAGRDFLVPWNNDVDHDQTGTLTVPAELLKGDRKVYDLHALKPVTLSAGGTFGITLPPGGGHVYLVGDAKAFDVVRANILRHRVWPERVKARSLVQRRANWPKTLSFEKADALIAKLPPAKPAQKAALLTVLGIVFGVCSVIAMLAIGEGASHEAQEQIKNLGSQNIILKSVKPPDEQKVSGNAQSFSLEYGLTYADIKRIGSSMRSSSVRAA
jgi:hypothetical protein